MLFSDVEAEVLRITNDPGGRVYVTATIERYTEQALRKIGVAIGRTIGRSLFSLVQSQNVYTMNSDMRRIENVRIVPADNTLAKSTLIQVDFTEIPNVTETENDPTHYAVSTDGGTDNNVLELYLWPASARTTANALVVDYDIDYRITPSTPGQAIGVMRQLEQALIYEVSALCLLESDDGSDVEKAKIFRQASDDEIRRYQPMDSVTKWVDTNRRMP